MLLPFQHKSISEIGGFGVFASKVKKKVKRVAQEGLSLWNMPSSDLGREQILSPHLPGLQYGGAGAAQDPFVPNAQHIFQCMQYFFEEERKHAGCARKWNKEQKHS